MGLEQLQRRVAGVLLGALLVVGCGPGDGPPQITLDRTTCGHCGMLVSDLRTAAALRSTDGSEQVFDDIGCLLGAIREMPQAPERVWVREASTERWLEAGEAVFTREADVWTPMGSGLLAWAEETVPVGAARLSFEDLLQDGGSAPRGHAR